MKIATRLTIGFAGIGALMAVMAALFFVQTGQVQAQFRSITGERLQRLMALQQIQGDSREVGRALLGLLVLTDPKQLREQYERIKAASASTSQSLASLQQVADGDEGARTLDALMAAHARYAVPRDAVVKLVRSDRLVEAKTMLIEELEPKQRDYMSAVEALVGQEAASMAAATRDVDVASTGARAKTLVLVGIALVLAALVAVWIIRSVSDPLRRAVRVSQSVAAGDLGMAFDAPPGHGETAQLLIALKAMQASLTEVVSNVRQNSEQLATASAEIAQGNADLSARTEQQAGALEKAASSMEQLSATVRGNADNARRAKDLALDASTVARQGGAAVGRVIETMRGIDGASKKIADILGVIDGIAFQTNILALNASVEAARAGEQGRGFAVVASEVRGLAQRSAEAAREVRVLIDASVAQVEQGSTLVDEAGATMQQVVAAIQRVSEIATEISAASHEQSDGVAEVSRAVTQMEQATQQNAALVEQSAAAAESLREQAHKLVQAVAVFKLSRASDAPVPRVPAATSAGNAPAVEIT